MRLASRDLTIDSMLVDPMIQAAMRADGVDPVEFEAVLRSASRRIRQALRQPSRILAEACFA